MAPILKARGFGAALAIHLALSVTGAAAQVPAPAGPTGDGTAPGWRSAMEGYSPFADQPTGNWKAANDEVGKIGGWRAYAREASAPDPAVTATPPTPSIAPTAPSIAPVAPAAPASPHGHGHAKP